MEDFSKVLPQLFKIPFFSEFCIENEKDVAILKMFYEHCNVQKFKKGDIIIKEGDHGELCYILYKGKIHITRKTPAGDEIAIADLSSTEHIFFGETAIISNEARSATVASMTDDCTVIAIKGKDFIQMCNKEPVLGYKVLFFLAKSMAKTIQQLNRDKAALYEALFNEIEGNQ